MTDVVTGPGSDTASTEVISDAASVVVPGDVPPGDAPLEWAPIEPAPKKKRLGLWIGIAAGVVALGAGAASLVLIAPGTTVAGIPIGWQTPGMAAETITNHLADAEITLTGTGAGDDVVVTGADLGASLDAEALADEAFADRPMWNVTMWGAEPIPATITLDAEAAESALRAAVPSSYEDATDATVVFDEASGAYTTTPAASGTGIDIDDLTDAFIASVAAGSNRLDYPGGPAEALPEISDDEATATADELNGMLASIGFYVGEERTVPVEPAVAAGWLSVVPEDGALRIEADRSAIQTAVDALADTVNRAPVDATKIVNASGDVLREVTAGANGRELGDVSQVAGDFAEQLSTGDAVYELPVEEVPFETNDVVRQVEVNLTQQKLYLRENGEVVDSWLVSSGRYGYDTETGKYTINWKLSSQNMGREDTSVKPFYYQPNVKWVMYFNGDQALHGVYWHHNWGHRGSHGCVGMPESRAKQIFDWAPKGVEVWVHN